MNDSIQAQKIPIEVRWYRQGYRAKEKWQLEQISRVKAETIERCAQVAESLNDEHIAECIRTLKDQL